MSRKPRHPTAKPPERVVEEAAFHLANGTFVPVILGDRDYVSLMSPELGDQVMRVLLEHFEFDEDWNVTNSEEAMAEAATWLRDRLPPERHPG
jgi:hypothetical protein